MAKYLYISPVGTSLLQNFMRSSLAREFIEKYREYRPENWSRILPSDPLNKPPDGLICRVYEELKDPMLSFILSDPRRSSAELNGLLGMRELYHHRFEDIAILLYYTNTCNSRICGDYIAEYLEKLGFKAVKKRVVKSLSSAEEFEEGLIEVLDKVVAEIVKHRSPDKIIYVNATPGFKAETTFLVIASILAGADAIVYIHESFREPITLPIPPLDLRREIVEDMRRLYGGEQCLDTGIVNRHLGVETVDHLTLMGVLDKRGEIVCVKEWFRKLLEIMGL